MCDSVCKSIDEKENGIGITFNHNKARVLPPQLTKELRIKKKSWFIKPIYITFTD